MFTWPCELAERTAAKMISEGRMKAGLALLL